MRSVGLGTGHRLAAGAALADVNPHGLKNTRLGFLDGLADPVHAREVLAVGVVRPALAFNGDGISKQFHAPIVT